MTARMGARCHRRRSPAGALMVVGSLPRSELLSDRQLASLPDGCEVKLSWSSVVIHLQQPLRLWIAGFLLTAAQTPVAAKVSRCEEGATEAPEEGTWIGALETSCRPPALPMSTL